MNLKNKLSKIWPRGDSRGDTLIEVLVSVAILSLALAAAYALGSSSLRNSLEANQRTEALALAQAQAELLANAKNTDSNFATDYQINTPFCITLANAKTAAGTDNLCDGFNNTPYGIGVSYSSATGVFTVTAAWNSPNLKVGQAKLNLYYKLPGVYRKALVNTGAATSISNTTATLNGTVDPNGVQLSSCYFNYGLTTSYGSQANCSSLPVGTSGTFSVHANLNQLAQGGVYHFELCAANPVLGTNCDSDVSFTTADKPTVTTKSASGIGTTSATLNGSVNANGSDVTDCYFDIGTTTGYGSRVNCSSLPTKQQGTAQVNGSATGLTSDGTTYHYRLCASNVAGTNCDSDVSFQTAWGTPTLDSFTASPTSVSYGGSTTLSWSSSHTTYCSASGSWSGTKATSSSEGEGSLTSSSYTYNLSCTGPNGTTATQSQTVYVSSPPPPPAPEVYVCLNADFDSNGQQCNWGPFPSGFSCYAVAQYTDDPTCSQIPNDAISSFSYVNSVINVAVYWDWHYEGDSNCFASNTGYVGDQWNDQISSFIIGGC